MNHSFSSQLTNLRHAAKLTNRELARLADVPSSLISGLQNDNRRIGEYQARKIGCALQLTEAALAQFVLHAINNCSEKVLVESKPYPAEVLNLVAGQLRKAGILAQDIRGCSVAGDEVEQDVTLSLGNGRKAVLSTHLVCA
jgi:transcriptional regulator with XRE-family HTH domain